MTNRFCKIISILLVLIMIFNMVPMQCFAQEYQASLAENAQITSTELAETPTEKNADTYVLSEITDKRTEYSKEFLLSNGLHMATVYPDPVHYETAGGWEEIDNTLKATANGNYINTAGVWQVSFPQQLSGEKAVSVTKDGYTLSFALAGEICSSGTAVMASRAVQESLSVSAMKTSAAAVRSADTTALKNSLQYAEMMPDKLYSQLAYENIYANTDIIYDLDSNKIKESVVLNRYNDTLRGYRYTLNVGQLIPVLDDFGEITFYAPDRETVIMVMPAPYLLDANNAYSDDIQVSLTGSGSTYTLTYMLPQQWLADADRAWPVILDPVIEADTAAANILDRRISENASWAYNHHLLEAGYDDSNGKTRSYLQFVNLPALSSADVIVDASIQLYQPTTRTNSSMQLCVEVRKVTEDWDSTSITWANQPAYDSTIEDYCMVRGTPGYYLWSITDLVRDWYADGNYGLVFKSTDANEATGADNWMQFWSVDSGTNKPILSIVFRNNTGLESYWDYTTVSAGRAGTGYVNNYTGNLVWTRDIMGFGGNRMPVSITHVYNANDRADNPFALGCGWRTNFHQRVYQWSENSNYYVWEDADGTRHYFLYDSANTYLDEDGLELTLTTNGSGSQKFCIEDKYGNKSFFDTYGRLAKQQNNQKTPSSISVAYTTDSGPLISSVKDGAGRVYKFSYSNNQLNRIGYYSTGSTEISYVTFSYSSSLLTAITDKDGSQCAYAYSSKLLTSAQDIDGYKLTFAYNTKTTGKPSRVSRIREYDGSVLGGELNIAYAHNQTTFTDHNGNVEIMQFNNFGNTVSIQDNEGHAQYAEYATDTQGDAGKGNQLTASSKLQNTVANLLDDSSFENGTLWHVVSGTASIHSSGYLGSKSLAMAGGRCLSPSFTLAAGKSCTFSAYVKTSDTGSYLRLYEGNTRLLQESIPSSNTWTRVQISYTNTSSSTKTLRAALHCESGETVYMDCAQIEKSPTASRYNILQNGDFSYDTNWTSSGFTSADGQVNSDANASAPQLGAKAMKMVGEPATVKKIVQQVNLSGSAGDTYIIAGWAKADSVPLYQDNENREFAVRLKFINKDGSTTKVLARFNPDSAGVWQYSAAAAVAKKAYSSITVEVLYAYNANTAYFDGIQLYKEEFSQSYEYDEETGNLLSVTDLQKQKTQYSYENNDLTKAILPDGSTLQYEYDDYHNVTKATTSEGLVYTFTYDAYGNNTSVSVTSGGKTLKSTATYKNSGNTLATTTDAAGNTTTYTYNSNTNVLESVQYPKDTTSTKTSYTYDSMYRMATASVTTDSGLALSANYTYTDDMLTKIKTGTTTYTLNYGNFALRSNVKIGSRTLAEYTYTDQNNYLNTLAFGNGDSVQYTYDQKGRVTKQTYEDGDTVSYRYDNNGALATVTDSATGITTTYYYDFIDRMMKYVERGSDYSHSVGYTYNTLNNLTKIKETINGSSYTTNYIYDEDNRVTSVSQSSTKQQYAYDNAGRLTENVLSYSDTTVVTNSFAYKNPTTTTTSSQIATHTVDAADYDKVYTYTYDKNGNITSVAVDGNTTRYVYDTANQLVREDNQAAGKSWTYTYDKGGNIKTKTQYAYTTGTLGTAEDTVSYTYGDSSWGDLLTKYDGLKITCDAVGNPTKLGNIESFTWEHGKELSTHSVAAEIAIITQPRNCKGVSGKAVSFSVKATGADLTYQWQVSTNGGSTWGDSTAGGYNTASISGFTITTGRDGNMYRCVITDGNGNKRISNTAQIILVPLAITDQPNNFYGREGNEVTFSLSASGEDLTYQWQVSTDGGSTWGNSGATGNKTSTISGFVATQARNGNMYRCIVTDGSGNTVTSSEVKLNTTDLVIYRNPSDVWGVLDDPATFSVRAYGQGLTYQWQHSLDGGETWHTSSAAGNKTNTITDLTITNTRLGYLYRCVVTDENGNSVASASARMRLKTDTWTYTYNADGMRTKRTDGYTTYEYVYNGGSLSQMTVGSHTLRFGYSASGAPLYVQWNSSRYFYVTNQQGDVTAIVSVNGIPVVEYTYDAWGNILSITGTRADNLGKYNPLRYRGYVYDVETGFYYLQSRYYDPEIGRFINADALVSTGQGMLGNNMFAYCNNNPANFIDSSGNLPVPSLKDFYNMHKQVQQDVAETYGYAIEVFVVYSSKPTSLRRRGFLDLYDATTNQYYEVKSKLQIDSESTNAQISNYDQSTIKDWRFWGYNIPSSPKRGTNAEISGSFQYRYWDVMYTFYANGKIYYTYTLNMKSYSEHVLLVSAALSGLAAGLRAGGNPTYRYGQMCHIFY